MACTGTTLFFAVKEQKLIIRHSFKMESNGPDKLRKLVIDIRDFICTDLLTRTFPVVEEVLADSSSQQCSHQALSF